MKKDESAELLEDLAAAAISGDSRQVNDFVFRALKAGIPAETIALAMMKYFLAQNIADDYRDEENIAQLLLGARAIRNGIAILRPHLQKNEQYYKYTAIIGTVTGDYHDLGKNLVCCLLESVGVNIVDLGIDVPAEQFVQAFNAYDDVLFVGISCLLSTSLAEMRKTVLALRRTRRRQRYYIMVGGGAVTQDIADEMGADIYTDSATLAADKVHRILEETYTKDHTGKV